MSLSLELKKRIEEDLVLIEQGKETYGTVAKQHNLPIPTVYRIHQEKLYKTKVEEAKDELEALEEKKEGLEQEINKLTHETEEIKAAFEGQGLNWEQGVQTLKAVTDLGAGLKRLRGEEAATKARLKEERGKHETTRRQISNLKRRKIGLQGEVNELTRIYNRYMRWYRTEAPRLDEREWALRKSIYRLEKKEGSLKKRVERLSGEEEEAKRRITKLGSEEKGWKQVIEKLRSDYGRQREALQKECDKLVEEASARAKMIVKGAEQKRHKMLKEVEDLKKERGILEAESGLVRTLLENDIRKVRKKPREIRMRLSPEEFKALEKIAPLGDVKALIRQQITHLARANKLPKALPSPSLPLRLPKLPPLTVKKKKRAKIAS